MAEVPGCCYACESRSVGPHCKSPSCPWVTCTKCGAFSGRVANWPGLDPPTKRASYGGRDRGPEPPP